jgi:type I restriction enzyme S subunit
MTPFSDEDIEYFGAKGDPRAFVTNLSDLHARFDATNHVPIVRSVVHKLRRGRYPLARLDSMCRNIKIPARFKRSYAEVADGVPYLMPSQLVGTRPYGMKALSVKQASDSSEYLLNFGELLLTTDGTVGRVHPVTKRMVGWFGSNNIARLSDSDTNIWFLYAFLSTPFGRHQIRKDIYGGVVDHISEDHISSVLFVPKCLSRYRRRSGISFRGLLS